MKKKLKIMIVEDELIFAHDLESILKSRSYEVIAIEVSGEDALEKIKNDRPDLVMVDIKLSGDMDGIELSAMIHSLYNIPVIFISAFANSSTIQKSMETKPLCYLVKPISDLDLLQVIEDNFSSES
jgi:CheY-like chemotaxis protein